MGLWDWVGADGSEGDLCKDELPSHQPCGILEKFDVLVAPLQWGC